VKRLLALAALAVSVVALPAATAVSASAATAHGSATAAAAAAPAATGYNRCPAARLCIFNGAGGKGEYCVYQRATRANAITGCGFRQKGWLVRSIWDRHSYAENLYAFINFQTSQGAIGAGVKENAAIPAIISSFRRA